MPPPVVVKFATAGAKEVEAVFATLTKKIQDFSRAQGAAAIQARQTMATIAKTPTARTSAANEARAVQRAEAEKQRAIRQTEQARERAASKAEQLAKRVAATEEREARRSARAAAAAKRTSDAEFKKLGARGAAFGGRVTGSVRSMVGTATGMMSMLGAGLGVAAVGEGVSSAYKLNRRGVMLSNMTQMPGATSRTSADLVGQARGVAVSTGVGAEDVMSMMEIVSAQAGGAIGLERLLPVLGEVTKLAVAGGVKMEDMGGIIAAAFKNGVDAGDDLLGMIRSFIAQGKAGSIEFRDFADELARLGGVGKKFGSGAQMLTTMGGFAQIASETAIGKEGSRTVVVDMMREFSQGPKLAMLSQMGVKTHNDDGKLRDPTELMADTIAAIEGGKMSGVQIPGLNATNRASMSPAAFKSAVYSTIFTGRSEEIATNLAGTYRAGYTGTYGDFAGKKYTGAEAVSARIREASRPYEMTKEMAAAEYAAVEKTMALAKAHEEFKAKMADLLPQITLLIPKLVQLSDGFARLVVWLSKNPLEGLGLMVGAAFAREIAAAAVGKTIEAGFANIFTSVAGGKAGGGALGALGAAGVITLTAATVYLAGTKVIDEMLDTKKEDAARAAALTGTSSDLGTEARMMLEGGIKDPKRAQEMVNLLAQEATKNRVAATAGPGMATEMFGGLAFGFGKLTGNENMQNTVMSDIKRRREMQGEMNTTAVQFDKLSAALARAITELGNVKAPDVTSPAAPARNEPAARAGVR